MPDRAIFAIGEDFAQLLLILYRNLVLCLVILDVIYFSSIFIWVVVKIGFGYPILELEISSAGKYFTIILVQTITTSYDSHIGVYYSTMLLILCKVSKLKWNDKT